MPATIVGTTFPNRLLVTASAPGTAAIALGTTTPVIGYKTFASLTNGQVVDYFIEGIDASGQLTGTWEVGTGTYNSVANTFSRTNIIETHAGTTAFNFTTNVRIGVGPSTNLYKKFDAVTTQRISFNYTGGIIASTGESRWYPPRNITLTAVYAAVGGVSINPIQYTIKKNGTILGSYFEIPASTNKSTSSSVSYDILTTDYLTIDVITNGGSNLTVYIEYV